VVTPATQTTGTFTATGPVPVGTPLLAIITNQRTTDPTESTVQTTDAGNWAGPLPPLFVGDLMRLDVCTQDHKLCAPNPSTGLHTAPAAAPARPAPLAGGGYGNGGAEVTITSPAAGSAVTVPFSAYGTSSGCSGVRGTLTVGGTVYKGSRAVDGPNWQINFNQPQGVPGGAELKVTCGTGSASESISLYVPGGF
jgi:hypothetical protein